MHQVLVNCLVDLAQENSVVRLTDCLDMTIAVDLDVKPQTKQTILSELVSTYSGLALGDLSSSASKNSSSSLLE